MSTGRSVVRLDDACHAGGVWDGGHGRGIGIGIGVGPGSIGTRRESVAGTVMWRHDLIDRAISRPRCVSTIGRRCAGTTACQQSTDARIGKGGHLPVYKGIRKVLLIPFGARFGFVWFVIGLSNGVATIRTRTTQTRESAEVAFGQILFALDARDTTRYGQGGKEGHTIFFGHVGGDLLGGHAFAPPGIGAGAFAGSSVVRRFQDFVGLKQLTCQSGACIVVGWYRGISRTHARRTTHGGWLSRGRDPCIGRRSGRTGGRRGSRRRTWRGSARVSTWHESRCGLGGVPIR